MEFGTQFDDNGDKIGEHLAKIILIQNRDPIIDTDTIVGLSIAD